MNVRCRLCINLKVSARLGFRLRLEYVFGLELKLISVRHVSCFAFIGYIRISIITMYCSYNCHM